MYEILSINTAALSKIQGKVSAVNKRAAKIGSSMKIEIQIGERTVKSNEEGKVYSDRTEVIVWGAAPVVQGARLLATVRHLEAGDFFASAVGDEINAIDHVNKGSFCEHCSTKRRRNETFVIETVEGGVMRVGRNCLADFIRKEDAAAFVLYHNWISDVKEIGDDESWGGFCGGYSLATDAYLEVAAHWVNKDGFKPSSFEDKSTRSEVACWFTAIESRSKSARQWAEENRPDAAAKELAAKVKAYFGELETDNNFLMNCKVAIANPTVERTEGVLCAAVGSYFKETEKAKEIARKEAERKAEIAAKKNEHFGNVGDRIEIELTCTRHYRFDTAYGTKSILTFEDSEGRCFVWKGSSPTANTTRTGDTAKGKGTIKDHDEYKGRLQTELTRCKFEVTDENGEPREHY